VTPDPLRIVLDAIIQPAVRLTARGQVSGWNDAAGVRFPWLMAGQDVGVIAPPALAVHLNGGGDGDDIALPYGHGRLLRLPTGERLWLSEAPQAGAFDVMDEPVLVWEYDSDTLPSADQLRLVAANRASESIGGRQPMRSWIGKMRGEMQVVDALNDVYLRVARTGQAEEVKDLRGLDGRIYDARVFAMPGKRLAVTFHDVTEARSSLDSYRRIFDRSHDAILIIDPESERVLDANTAAETVYGRTREQILRMSIQDVARHRRPGMSEQILRAGFLHFQTVHLRSDGAEVHLDVHAMPTEYNGHQAVLAVMRDMTGQTLARKALEASEEKYRALVSNVPVVLWTATNDSRLTYVSPSVEHVTGYSVVEMIAGAGMQLMWWLRMHEGDRPRVEEAMDALFRDGTTFDVEYRFQRKDDTWAWFSARATHTYEQDGVLLMDGVTQDITDRKRGELQQLGLAGFGRRAVTETDTEALMRDACTTVAEVLEVPMTSILIYEATEDRYRVAAACGLEVDAAFRVPNEADRLVTQVVGSDRPLAYDDLPNETRFNASDMIALGTKSGVVAPISAGAARYGILHAHTTEPRRFYERDKAFVQSMATVLAAAMLRGSAERELERREAQLADAQAIAHIGSLEIDVETGQIQWSNELYRITGLARQPKPLTVEFVSSIIPPEIREWFLNWRTLLEAGQAIDSEYVMYTVDTNEPRTVRARARLVTDRITNRPRIVGTVQDVTESREAEAALRDREQRLQLIVARLPVILWSTDAELRVNSLTGAGFAAGSSGTMGVLGLTLDELIGKPPAASKKTLGAAMEGQTVTFDTKRERRDLRVHIEPLRDERGNITGTVGIAFDTTEERRAARANRRLLGQLERSAEEWRNTFDSIQAPLVIVDQHGHVSRMNAAALQLSRFDDYSPAIGTPVQELGENAIWNDIAAIASASATHHQAIALQGGDRDGRAWDLLASPAARRHTIVIASDVTELVRMQERLLRTERMSEMGALVAGVAHEVRNPLFGISATLDAFENKHNAEQFRDYIGALREQVERMSQLMHELLEYGRPLAAVLEPACIAVVVNTGVAAAGSLAATHGVTVRSSVPPSLVQVPMDRPRMLQVFDNLLANAIQHSKNGGIVEVSAEVVTDGQSVRILVEDRGPGFQPADLPRLFEPFFTRRRGGTGLGLSLVRRIVEEHNGTVTATNREGGGASMLVTLPVVDAGAAR
jgi:PAS domain S-box-containing protein